MVCLRLQFLSSRPHCYRCPCFIFHSGSEINCSRHLTVTFLYQLGSCSKAKDTGQIHEMTVEN